MHQPSPDSSSEPQQDAEAIKRSLYETWKELESVRQKIRVATEEITRANASLQKLRDIEKKLRSIAVAKAPLLSPFQHLPRDILDEIAGNCISTNNNISRMDYGVWPLTRVCKAWRIGILSLPRLWSSFSIPDLSVAPLELVETVLQWSQLHPLSFKASVSAYHSYCSKDPPKRIAENLSLLVKHSKRWRNVQLGGAIPAAPLLGIHESIPHLESLRLDIRQPKYKDRWQATPRHRSLFRTTPKLKSLFLTEEMNISKTFFEFPIHQLHELELWVKNQSERLGIWEQLNLCCNRLVSLRVGCPKRFQGFMKVEEHVTLPALKNLRVDRASVLLPIFRLPSLNSLDLHGIDIDKESIQRVQTFLDSNPDQKLTTFSISGQCDYYNAESFYFFIKGLLSHSALRSLCSLGIKNDTYKDDSSWPPNLSDLTSFLSHLTVKPHQTPDSATNPAIHLANLRDFMLDTRFVMDNEEGHVLDALRATREFIISRTVYVDRTIGSDPGNLPISAQLENVHILYNEHEQPITLSSLDRLEARILDLKGSRAVLDCGCEILSNVTSNHIVTCTRALV